MMLNLGVNLIVFGFVGSILINIIMLMKFLSRAKQAGPAIGEIVHILFMGILGKSYPTLLLNDGIEPTIVDELRYRISIILGCTMLVGLVFVVLGLVTAD